MSTIWDAVLLANTDRTDPGNDITKEIGSISTLFQVKESELDQVIATHYEATKVDFAETIDSHLPSIYARCPYLGLSYFQWWQAFGFTYSQTDEIRELMRPLQIDGADGVYTPDQIIAAITANKVITIRTMTSSFVALFIKKAFIKTGSQWKSSTNSGFDPFADKVLMWDKEFTKRWRECQNRLFIDFYKTGQVQDSERGVIKRRTMSRG